MTDTNHVSVTQLSSSFITFTTQRPKLPIIRYHNNSLRTLIVHPRRFHFVFSVIFWHAEYIYFITSYTRRLSQSKSSSVCAYDLYSYIPRAITLFSLCCDHLTYDYTEKSSFNAWHINVIVVPINEKIIIEHLTWLSL